MKFFFKQMLIVSAFYLEKQKSFIPKKIFLKPLSISKQRSFVYWPNFQWRFWAKHYNFLFPSKSLNPPHFLLYFFLPSKQRDQNSNSLHTWGDFVHFFTPLWLKLSITWGSCQFIRRRLSTFVLLPSFTVCCFHISLH